MNHLQYSQYAVIRSIWSVLWPAQQAKVLQSRPGTGYGTLLNSLAACLLLGLLLQAGTSQAQGRPKQYQIPTTFDSVYTKRPARMAFFIAWEYYGGGQIEWVTLREDKITAFAVQYSPDGRAWQETGRMDAHPGITKQQNYTLYDSNIRRYGVPVLYYRVQEIAKNGHFTYSPVRSIRLSNPDTSWRTPAIPASAQGLSAPGGR